MLGSFLGRSGTCKVRRTREVGQRRRDRKNVPEVRISQDVTEMSRHVLWLENSMSLSVAAVCRMRELARGRQGVGRGVYGRVMCHTE